MLVFQDTDDESVLKTGLKTGYCSINDSNIGFGNVLPELLLFTLFSKL